MDAIRREAAERLEAWEHALLRAVEEEPPELERRALSDALSQLRSARDALPGLGADQLERLHERLGRDPIQWIERMRKNVVPEARATD